MRDKQIYKFTSTKTYANKKIIVVKSWTYKVQLLFKYVYFNFLYKHIAEKNEHKVLYPNRSHLL